MGTSQFTHERTPNSTAKWNLGSFFLKADIVHIASKTFRAAAIIVSTLPILLVYPFLQKYFVMGMTLGVVKQ
ncbi:hypothetical protein BC351_29495 [Paenibacillus ferrarius]|uniref:ABC transmembrane type-1 domain-containing protein n=1 Tax=Paenibacillus ferrarius TaxID=1469647 RepID=A0A1V4HIA1_9BACL|nr:hypothetical protein BC351_29495 [Paenibacillus ferrarius]